jgi:hypothetical protein
MKHECTYTSVDQSLRRTKKYVVSNFPLQGRVLRTDTVGGIAIGAREWVTA